MQSLGVLWGNFGGLNGRMYGEDGVISWRGVGWVGE